ncbi:hypothetical protein DPMN_002894 [Dreissena polymorpha]|uniref:Uncharacterized protein n=1 Tax=Dreissena polymorpha TaxID=45954 RepID=A0A9D4MM80_DREPO|nr:hypothetical protein DPMN_002894 [Dreissena polymorpha]
MDVGDGTVGSLALKLPRSPFVLECTRFAAGRSILRRIPEKVDVLRVYRREI